MKKQLKLLFILIFIFHNASMTKASDINSKLNIFNYITDKNVKYHRKIKNTQIVRNDYSIIVKVKLSPPDNLYAQKQEGFMILKPLLTKNLQKAAVIWQENEYSYGKIAAISGNYIDQYLHKNISKNNFINYFILSQIEPSFNYASKQITNKVEDKDIYKCSLIKKNADIYRKQGQYDSSIRLYKNAIKKNKNDVISMFWIAEILKEKNQISKAKKIYVEILEIDPNFVAALQRLKELK